MVASGVPFHITVEPLRKPVPVTVRVKAAPPAEAAAGLNEVIAGALMVNGDDAEPALPVFTVTFAVPAEASWAVVTAAVSEVALTYVVVSAVVPHITVEPLTKPLPATVRVKAALPATAVEGVSDAIPAVTRKVEALEDALPVFCTVMLAAPAEAIWAVVTAAVTEVALT